MRVDRYSAALTIILMLMGCAPRVILGQREENWEVSGYVGAETRWFYYGPSESFQHGGAGFSLTLEPEFYRGWEASDTSILFEPYIRLDSEDTERTHFDIRELYWQKIGGSWDLKVGLAKVFWGVTESRHLVDIINQTDQIENIDTEDKLGQPMVNFTLINNWGTLDFFFLPYFRERTFAGREGRLRSIPHINTDRPVYESGAERWHPDLAVRYSRIFGNLDLGIYYFYGTSRDPLFEPDIGNGDEIVLRPVYNLMQQGGLDLQYTFGGWLLKFESILRSGRGQHFQALTVGFEYTLYGLFGTTLDMGILSEYHYDSRGETATDPFNNDIFAGTRITLNDEQDTAFIGGMIYDHDNGTTSYRFEFERRLGDSYKLIIEAQQFARIDSKDLLFSLRRDSFLQVELRKYF